MASYIFMGAAIGTVSVGVGEAVLGSFGLAAQAGVSAGSSMLAYGVAGAVAGGYSGMAFSALGGGNPLQGALRGATWGGVSGGLAGLGQHLAFSGAMGNIDNWMAGGDEYAWTNNIPDGAVVVRGKRGILKPIAAQAIPFPLLRPPTLPAVPISRDNTYHGNDLRNPNYHYVYQIFNYPASNPMAFSYGKEETDYNVIKYGIGEVADGGKRAEIQVRRLQRRALPGRSYDYVIKQTMIPGRSMALMWEKFYVYTFRIRHGYRPPLNFRP